MHFKVVANGSRTNECDNDELLIAKPQSHIDLTTRIEPYVHWIEFYYF